MAKWLIGLAAVAVASAAAILPSSAQAWEVPTKSPAPSGNDWPQWRGPNRDGIAVSSPKLLDSWPKDGPPLLWKSAWIPACEEGGCSSPVVADGKVFVYSNAKQPVGGGQPYQLVTIDLLLDAGWLPDLPDDLCKKIEAAWAAKNRPSSAEWEWWNRERTKKAGELDAFLAKKPELDRYIKDFIAELKPEEAKKDCDYVKKRLCMDTPRNKWGVPNAFSWEQLVKLNAMRDKAIPTYRQWLRALEKIGGNDWFAQRAFVRAFTYSDTVVCLDAATGKEIWKKVFPVDEVVTRNPGVQWWFFGANSDGGSFGCGVSATPAVWGAKCYAVGSMGLYCLSAKDGALLWQVKGPPEHSSPLIVNGIVYSVGCAYDAENGRLLWQNQFWDGKHKKLEWTARYSSPLLLTAGGKDYVITTDFRQESNSSYCCLDMETGKALWTVKSPIGVVTVMSGDVLIAPPLYGFSETKAYKVTPSGAELLWKQVVAGGAGHIYQDHLYVPSTYYSCVDLKTGEFNWKKSIRGGVAELSSTVLADGKIFTPLGEAHQLTKNFGDLTYALSMIKAAPEKYVELGVFNPRMCMMTSPAVAGGKLYLRLLDGVACYDLQEHGVYLDGVAAKNDSLTFRFKQTGGGLVAKDAANGSLKDVLITDAGGVARPAKANIDGDNLVIDIKDVSTPFAISCGATNSLAGKNGLPVPAFGWNETRLLKFRKCFDNTIMLGSDLPLQQNGSWNKAEAFVLTAAKVSRVELDPTGKGVSLFTDRTWKIGEAVTLTYPCFSVDQGDARREKLSATVAELQRAAARFIKVDENTSGNWKGTYGTEGALIAGDKGAAAPKCATATVMNKEDGIPWAANAAETRYLQKSGEAKERTVTSWHAPEQFDIAIEITDGKEHQVALYCMAWGPTCDMTVAVQDADTKAVLGTQNVKDFVKGKYLVWNLKGQVLVRLTNNRQDEGNNALASGLFIDPPAPAAK